MTRDQYEAIVADVDDAVAKLAAIGEADLIDAAAWARGAANAAPALTGVEELNRLLTTVDVLTASANYLSEVTPA